MRPEHPEPAYLLREQQELLLHARYHRLRAEVARRERRRVLALHRVRRRRQRVREETAVDVLQRYQGAAHQRHIRT